MSDQSESLTVKITADAGSATSGIEELQQNLEKIVGVQVQLSEAADKAATAQEQGAQRATDAQRRAASAQQAVIDQLKDRFSSGKMDEAAMAEAVSNMETALRIKQLEHETQMGRQSLEQHKALLEQLVAKTEESSAARIAAERAVQAVNAQMLEQHFSDMREDVVAARMSADEQRQILESLADDDLLSLKNRAMAAGELARIEAEDAKQAALAVVEAEKEKARIAKEEALKTREAHKEAQEFSYVAMDIGYMLPGAGQLSNAAYLMRDLSTATGDMLLKVGLLAAGFAAVAGGVDYLSHAIDDAGKMQEQMASLGVAVHNQGGDWKVAQQGVEEWATTLQHATTYSRSDAVTAVNDLVTAGTKLGDAEKLVGVATDVAAGSHRKLIDVVNLIKEAEAGRGQGLVRLDEHLKPIIHSHGTLQQVVDQLAHDFSGEAADATDTYEGKQAQLKNTLGTLSEKIGNDMLPMMTDLASDTLKMVDGIDSELPKAEKAWHNFQSAMSSAIGWIEDHKAAEEVGGVTIALFAMRGALASLATTTLPAFGAAMVASFAEARVAVSEFFASIGPVGWTILAVGTAATVFAEGWSHDWGHVREVTESAINGIAHGLGDLLVKLADVEIHMASFAGRTPVIGDALKRDFLQMASGALVAGGDLENAHIHLSPLPQSAHHAPPHKPPPSKPDTRLDDGDKRMGSGNGSGGAGHVAGEVSDRESGFDSTFSDLGSKTDAVRQQIQAIKDQEADLQHALKMTTTDAEHNAKAHENQKTIIAAYGDEVFRISQAILAENIGIAHQESVVNSLHNAYEQARARLQAYQNSLNGVTHLTAQQTQHLRHLQDAERDADQAERNAHTTLNAMHATMLQHQGDLQSTTEHWNNLRDAADEMIPTIERARNLQLQQLQDEEATYNLSTEQQLAYYAARRQNEISANGDYTDEANRLWSKVVSLEGDTYKQRADAHKKLVDEIYREENTLLDGIIVKHQSFRDTLKTIWDDIAKNFAASLEKMLESGPLKQFNADLASLFGNGQGFGGAHAGGALALSGLLGIASPAGASGLGPNAAIGSASNPAWVKLHADSVQAMTGSPSGLAAAVTDGSGVPVNIAGITNPDASVSYQDAQGNSYSTGTGGLSVGQKNTQGVMSGISFGMMAGSALGGNMSDAAIGSAIGSGLGLAFGHNGVAAEIGGAIGGAVLSFLGPHLSPEQTPDTSQAGYQQFLANMEGKVQNSHGALTFAEGAYDTTIGSKSLADQMSAYINNPADYAGAPAGIKDAIQHLQTLAGPGGSLALNTSDPEKNGYFNLANGQKVKVTDFETWINEIQQYQGNPASSVFTISRTYPTAGNPSDSNSYGPNGTYKPVPTTVPPTVNLTVQGSVIGPGGLDVVARAVAQQIQRIQNGAAPGTYGFNDTLASQGNY